MLPTSYHDIGTILSLSQGLSVGPDTLSLSLTFVTVDDDVPICQAYGISGAQQISVLENILELSYRFPSSSSEPSLHSLLQQLWKSALESNE